MSTAEDSRRELETARASLSALDAAPLPPEQVALLRSAVEEKIAALEAGLAAGAEKPSKDRGRPAEAPQGTSARVQGSGAVGQGDRPAVGGANSLVFGAGSHFEIHSPAPGPGASREALEEAYLSRLVVETSRLDLSGVDPAAAGQDAAARLRLDAVYTALLTTGSSEEGPERPDRALGREPRQASAVEQLDRHRHMVLLGDPGGGKSSFVNFVALCLAGERLGLEEANLAKLVEPLPDDQPRERGKEAEPQRWSHGALLPVRVVLRDFAATGLPPAGEAADGRHLWDFIVSGLETCKLGDYAPHLERHLLETGGLLLLDGLDEVPKAESRRQQIRQAVRSFVDARPKCRVLLTSRTYAYQKQEWRLPGFAEAVLAPFSEAQIRRFIDRWYSHAAALGRFQEEDAAGRAQLLKTAVFSSDRLRALADRPLLLTLMASLHAWRGGSLPERRERLYAETVELLLDVWERQRVRRGPGGELLLPPSSLTEWLKVDRERVREVLEQLAFEAHAAQPELHGTADVAEPELVQRLLALSDDPDARPGRLVEYLSERAGLLVARGVGVYTFPHRTIQEYLAACHLTGSAGPAFPDEVAELARQDPDRWREAVLLAAAKAAGGNAGSAWELAEALCWHDPPPSGEQADRADEWGAQLAAQALVESADLRRVSDRHRPKLEKLRAWLLYLMRSSKLPAVERALAGDNLAHLGDPRFDPEQWYLPCDPLLGFVEVPAGPFLMGSDPKRDSEALSDEQEQHELQLPVYYLSRYPVTVAQFRVFVETSGHSLEDPRSLDGPPSRPVVLVTWFEALEYCRWLDARLQELAPGRLAAARDSAATTFWRQVAEGTLRATLPSEAEWEKAARGSDGRIYPWGDTPDPELANYDESNIGHASAVGCFPEGVSPLGCEEMSGNVWEWTRSLWRESYGSPAFGYPYKGDDGREEMSASAKGLRVLRGGSFWDDRRSVRCACRFGIAPRNRDDNLGFRVVLSPFTSGL